MTATLHIARAPYHPLATFTRWLASRLRPRRPAAVTVDFEALRRTYPVSHEQDYRHLLDDPALEDAFARLAADHPQAVTPADGGPAARTADREQLLLAVCDRWFREAHPAPEHRWPPATVAAYQRLMADVHACFHPGGGAA
ncbi:hypothetical protein ACFOOM_12480 [Streptomyces echinoruber]|nr:hypothetical protein [Streptomyces echinoruber]